MNLSGPTNVTHANPGEERISKEMASSVLASHMPGIDVLRGAAILSVVVFHGMSYSAPDMKWGNPFAQGLYSLTSWGWLGVNLFFVLSGFLISGILDDSRGGGHLLH